MAVKITPDNYAMYKRVYEIFIRNIYKTYDGQLSPEYNPIAILNSWEVKNSSIAKKGLQAGLNDCLSSLKDYPNEILFAINRELEENKLPNIHTLSGAIQKTIKRVLKTGVIKNLDQFYIIKEILDDTTSAMTSEERRILSNSLGTYEIGKSR